MQNLNKNILIIVGITFILLAVLLGIFIVTRSSSVEGPVVNQKPKEPMETEISWEEAVQLIRDCEVTLVFQDHSKNVGLTLKDGTSRSTKEPVIDLVLEEAAKATTKCGFTIDAVTE